MDAADRGEEYQPAGRARRTPLSDPADPRHGTVNGYINHHCRCDECRSAKSELNRREYIGRVVSTA